MDTITANKSGSSISELPVESADFTNNKPVTRNPQRVRVTRNTKPETRNAQHAPRNPKAETRNAQHAPRNPKRATRNAQPVTRNPHPATRNTQHAPRNPKRATRNTQPDTCYAANLGLMDYNQAWELQSRLVAARINGSFNRDTILFLEHPAVFTLGRRGGRNYLRVEESFLKQSGITIVQAERGGYITYHGPGQLVVYPIIDLETRRLGVPDFVAALEEIMLQTVKTWGIQARRNTVNAGIWMDDRKMGSIGIALRKGISFHGLALNVNVDLTPFSWIQPCGLSGVSMTSVRQELGREIPMHNAIQTLMAHFHSVLGFTLSDISRAKLEAQL